MYDNYLECKERLKNLNSQTTQESIAKTINDQF